MVCATGEPGLNAGALTLSGVVWVLWVVWVVLGDRRTVGGNVLECFLLQAGQHPSDHHTGHLKEEVPHLSQASHYQSTKQRVFVVHDLQTNLLGLPAIIALQPLCWVDTVSMSEDDILKRFLRVFNGLGSISEEYAIQLRDDAIPYSAQCGPTPT